MTFPKCPRCRADLVYDVSQQFPERDGQTLYCDKCGNTTQGREVLLYIQKLAEIVAESDKNASEARAELVIAMKEAYGPHTLQQIGEAAGLSRQRVEQLIKRPSA